VIVRVILTPSERRELLRAVSVLGGDRYTNHVGHFQSAFFASIDIASSVVRVQAMRVSAESNDLNSARVGFSSFRPRARDVDRYRARPRNRRKKFSQRASAACVSRVRPVVEASRARLRVPRDARAHAADVFSKRTNFSTRVLGYFKGHEPSMDLKSSKRQLKIFNARARTDRKGPQRLYFVRFFTTLMVYYLVSVLYFPHTVLDGVAKKFVPTPWVRGVHGAAARERDARRRPNARRSGSWRRRRRRR
jgi:hypothetical protein